MSTTVKCRVLHERDSVGVVLDPITPGDQLSYKLPGSDETQISALEDIPPFHKFALKSINRGDKVFKYGQVIGRATLAIQAGQHVHSHNLTSIREDIAE
ncbi:MAG TPA: UxaA family hydrolase [Desulfosporosinus sp.]|nr:UxaA family hydrolase [Desulfosporosinus sp.]